MNVLKADARLNWINKHNDSKKLFTTNDWKNAGRNDRFINILPENIVKDKLEELINDTDIDEYLYKIWINILKERDEVFHENNRWMLTSALQKMGRL